MTDLRAPTVPVPILLLRAGHEVVSAAVVLADVARGGQPAGAFIGLWTPVRHASINKAQIAGVTES